MLRNPQIESPPAGCGTSSYPLSVRGWDRRRIAERVAWALELVFMLSIGYFVTPALLGGLKETFIAQLIEQQVSVLIDWSFAAALAILLLGVTLLIYYLFNRVLGLERIWGGV